MSFVDINYIESLDGNLHDGSDDKWSVWLYGVGRGLLTG